MEYTEPFRRAEISPHLGNVHAGPDVVRMCQNLSAGSASAHRSFDNRFLRSYSHDADAERIRPHLWLLFEGDFSQNFFNYLP